MHTGGVIVRTAVVVDVGALGNNGSIYRKTRRVIVFVPLTDSFYENNNKNGNYDDKNNGYQNRHNRKTEVKASSERVVKNRIVHHKSFLPKICNVVKT
jgi:hypothetical protein